MPLTAPGRPHHTAGAGFSRDGCTCVSGRRQLSCIDLVWRLLEPLRPEDREVFLALARRRTFARSNPSVERIVSTLLADRIDILSRRPLETMYESLDRRVYRRLLELARSYGGAADGTATVPLSQTQLAELVGATRPSVNQVLQRLAELRVVRLGRSRLEVLDLPALERRPRMDPLRLLGDRPLPVARCVGTRTELSSTPAQGRHPTYH
jgi:hypothetical protein